MNSSTNLRIIRDEEPDLELVKEFISVIKDKIDPLSCMCQLIKLSGNPIRTIYMPKSDFNQGIILSLKEMNESYIEIDVARYPVVAYASLVKYPITKEDIIVNIAIYVYVHAYILGDDMPKYFISNWDDIVNHFNLKINKVDHVSYNTTFIFNEWDNAKRLQDSFKVLIEILYPELKTEVDYSIEEYNISLFIDRYKTLIGYSEGLNFIIETTCAKCGEVMRNKVSIKDNMISIIN